MPSNYGRAGAKKTQRGLGGYSAYKTFKPMEVESRLTDQEISQYRSALDTLASPVQFKSAGGPVQEEYIAAHKNALEQASKLRELAAGRAFQDFTTEAMSYSKPWLVQRPSEGLITEQTVPHSLARSAAITGALAPMSFAGEGVRAAPPPGVAALAGERTFGSIGYEEAANIRRRKKGLSDLYSTTNIASTPGKSSLSDIDFGNLNFNFGPY